MRLFRRQKPIPNFPKFKPVTFADKKQFESFVFRFDCYSDFNFNSFYSWDTEGKHEISQLNGNLVAKFADYVTGAPFYSFIGENAVTETAHKLLTHAKQEGAPPILKLVPAVTAEKIRSENQLSLYEDPDNFDYVFSISELAELQGNRFKSKRRAAKKCEELGAIVIEDRSHDKHILTPILKLLNEWELEKRSHGKMVDMNYELTAIQRVIKNLRSQKTLILTCATYHGDLVGFSIDELLPNRYALSHYFKTLPGVVGLSEYLNQCVAKKLLAQDREFWNWEQDLGIESLHTMKLGYRPKFQQKKYIVEQKSL